MLRIGVDIVEVARVAELARRYGERFRVRVYTEQEWVDSGGRAESLAARFAAKEATIKALGSREPALREIEVVRQRDCQPWIRLSGRAAAIARALGVRELALSLSHERAYAVASVVVQCEGTARSPWLVTDG